MALVHTSEPTLPTERGLADIDLGVILDYCPDALIAIDALGRILHCSQRLSKLLGYARGELIGQSVESLMFEQHAEQHAYYMRRHQSTGENRLVGRPRRLQAKHKTGTAIPIELHIARYDGFSSEIRFIGVLREITSLLEIERHLADERINASTALEHIDDGVVRLDENWRILFANHRANGWFECSDVIGQQISDVLRLTDESTGAAFDFSVRDSGEKTVHLALLKSGDKQRIIQVRIYPFARAHSSDSHYVLVMQDVTERETIARRIQWQSEHDSLTGLINRRQLLRHMNRVLGRDSSDKTEHTLLFLDLDQFKMVNDTAGHIAGDELLRQLAIEMKVQLRTRDVVARLGGDEFAILLENCPLSIAERIAGDLIHNVQDFRFTYNDNVFRIGVSIGIASLDAGLTPEAALSQADQACYRAKDSGRNNYVTHTPDNKDHGDKMLRMHRITKALDQDRYMFRMQEIRPVSAALGDSYWEVLIRMIGSGGEEIMPAAFLPVAERYSHIHHIDRWVFNNLTAQLKPLVTQLGEASIPDISVNVSAKSLANRELCRDLPDLLSQSGLPLNKFCIEITETAAIANIGHTRQFLMDLHDRGCKIALDDFGSGLASFSYIRDLPIDIIKIDGSIVRDIVSDKLDHTIVESIQKIAEVMNCHSVAEFVETEEIRQRLEYVGVDYLQGFAIGKPILFDEWREHALH